MPVPWVVVAAAVLCAIVIAASAAGINARQKHDLTDLAAADPQAKSWLAIAENANHTSVLTVDDTAVAMLTRQGVVERTWPLAELRQVNSAKIRIGLLRRAGLRLQFTGDPPSNTLNVGFPVGGGLTVSAAVAAEVKAVLLAAQREHGSDGP